MPLLCSSQCFNQILDQFTYCMFWENTYVYMYLYKLVPQIETPS